MPRLATDKAGDALRRQPGFFGGAHDAAHLVTNLTGGLALGLAQRRPLAKRAPAFAARMPAAEWLLAVALFAAERLLAMTPVARAVAELALAATLFAAKRPLAVAAVARAVGLLTTGRPLLATPPARAVVSLVDNNRNLGQFAFSLCIYPALGRAGLFGAPVPRPRLALSSFLYVLNIY